jgi:hypothetical protein
MTEEVVQSETGGGKTAASPRRLQFSLRALFLFTAAVAVACSVFFGLPYYCAFPVVVFLLMAFPSLLIVMMVYGSRRQKAFAIGGIFPAGLIAFLGTIIVVADVLTDWNNDLEGWFRSMEKVTPNLKICTAGMFLCSLIAGLAGLGLWRLLRRDSTEP